MTQKFVVVGNDFPDAVFSTAEQAQLYCASKARQNREERLRTHPEQASYAPLIYWRFYEFTEDPPFEGLKV